MIRQRKATTGGTPIPSYDQYKSEDEEDAGEFNQQQCITIKQVIFAIILSMIVLVIILVYVASTSSSFNNDLITPTTTTTTTTTTKTVRNQKEQHILENNHHYSWEQEQERRREAVKQAFIHAWSGYEKYSFGHDELRPCTNDSRDNFSGFGATIVDSLDTMLLMGMKREYQKCRDFVENINFDKDDFVSLFETTIRYLGGFLGAYELTKDAMYLRKSEELAQKLLPAFNTNSGVPYTQINLHTGEAKNAHWHSADSILSEVGTLQLEFKYLSHHTRNPIYAERAERVMEVIRNSHAQSSSVLNGLYPNYLATQTGEFKTNWYSFGALGDSFYEYLLKQYLLTKDMNYHKMYRETVKGIKQHMLGYSSPNRLAYIAEYRNGKQIPKFDHLVCYTPGMLALGSTIKLPDSNQTELDEDLEIAKQLTHTCVKLYTDQASGLGPEIANFGNNTHDYYVQHPTYLLRPETVESLFIMYRVTGDKQYVHDAWKIFQAIERSCKTPAGYSGVKDVTDEKPQFDNAMESFFLSETLKYLYLIFSPNNVLSLDEFVLNTEAHPLRPFSPVAEHDL